MTNKKKKPNQKMQAWIDARKRYHLSHAHVQMARELGMNPKKLGSIDNHRQEPWKMPLWRFIEHLYLERFGVVITSFLGHHTTFPGITRNGSTFGGP